MPIKKYFLISAFAMVTIIACMYGISPHWFARTFMGISELDINLAHIFRAMMCLYFGLGLFWLYSAFNEMYTDAAVLTAAIFAGSLATGRTISLFADGRPSGLLLLYLFLELALVPIALWVFMHPKRGDSRSNN